MSVELAEAAVALRDARGLITPHTLARHDRLPRDFWKGADNHRAYQHLPKTLVSAAQKNEAVIIANPTRPLTFPQLTEALGSYAHTVVEEPDGWQDHDSWGTLQPGWTAIRRVTQRATVPRTSWRVASAVALVWAMIAYHEAFEERLFGRLRVRTGSHPRPGSLHWFAVSMPDSATILLEEVLADAVADTLPMAMTWRSSYR